MDTIFIDEAENLIDKYRIVMSAKEAINNMEHIGCETEDFSLIEQLTDMPVHLPNLKTEVMEAIRSVLNDQHDKIISRLREL